MEIRQVPIDKLKPWERNPRINDSAVDAVAKSVETFGFNVPILYDQHMMIVAGHVRWKAAASVLAQDHCGRGIAWAVKQIKGKAVFLMMACEANRSWSARAFSAFHAVGMAAGPRSVRNSSSGLGSDTFLCRYARSSSAECRHPGRARPFTAQELKSLMRDCGSLLQRRAKM